MREVGLSHRPHAFLTPVPAVSRTSQMPSQIPELSIASPAAHKQSAFVPYVNFRCVSGRGNPPRRPRGTRVMTIQNPVDVMYLPKQSKNSERASQRNRRWALHRTKSLAFMAGGAKMMNTGVDFANALLPSSCPCQ